MRHSTSEELTFSGLCLAAVWARLDWRLFNVAELSDVYFQLSTPIMCSNVWFELWLWKKKKAVKAGYFCSSYAAVLILGGLYFSSSVERRFNLPPAISSLSFISLPGFSSCAGGACWWGCTGGKTRLSLVWRRCWWTMETGIICSWILAVWEGQRATTKQCYL